MLYASSLAFLPLAATPLKHNDNVDDEVSGGV
jgi:hypothetical protein